MHLCLPPAQLLPHFLGDGEGLRARSGPWGRWAQVEVRVRPAGLLGLIAALLGDRVLGATTGTAGPSSS